MSQEQTQTNAEDHEPATSKLAIWSFACGLISASLPYGGRILTEGLRVLGRDVAEFIFLFTTFTAPPLFCIASITLCIMALTSIKQSEGKSKGKGLAIGGPAISIGHIVFFILRLTYGPWGGPMHW